MVKDRVVELQAYALADVLHLNELMEILAAYAEATSTTLREIPEGIKVTTMLDTLEEGAS